MRYPAFSILGAVLLSACSHYDEPDLQPIKDKTFTGDNLVLYYNGEPMPNKSVTISQNGDKATAKLFAEFDLSQLSDFGLSGSIPAPGVLPGEATSTLNLDMVKAGEFWNFTGSGSNPFTTFSYKGYANDERMALFLIDVKLSSPAITPEVWKPAPIKSNEGIYTSLPFFINWEYDPIPGVDIDLSPYLEVLTTLPVIPVYNNTAYMSISEAISLMLQSVAFRNDGNMIFTYYSSIGGATHLTQNLPNRFMYVMESQDKVKLYLNPTALFGMLLMAGSTPVPADDIKIIGNGIYPSGHTTEVSPGVMESIIKSNIGQKLAKSALSVILPQLPDGLPFVVSEKDGQMHICLDTPFAMEMMQQVITPLIADSEVMKALEAYMNESTTLKPLIPLLTKAMQVIPEAIERTNKMEVGMAFVPYN